MNIVDVIVIIFVSSKARSTGRKMSNGVFVSLLPQNDLLIILIKPNGLAIDNTTCWLYWL